MKKFMTLALAMIVIFALSACSNSETQQPSSEASDIAPSTMPEATEDPAPKVDSTDETTVPSDGGDSKILVAYFSLPETTDPNNMTEDEDNSVVVIDGEVLGNTQYVAYLIQENTDADIFRIEPKIPYPVDHDTLTDLAKEEQNSNARPEISAIVESIEQYDVIFVGYPNWWADMPMVLYTFLESYDLTGKTIIPFNTHGGSGFSNTISTIAELQPNATVERNGFTVSRNSVDSCESDVIAWLQSLNFAE